MQEIQREINSLFGDALFQQPTLSGGFSIGGMSIIERPDLLLERGDYVLSSSPAPGQ